MNEVINNNLRKYHSKSEKLRDDIVDNTTACFTLSPTVSQINLHISLANVFISKLAFLSLPINIMNIIIQLKVLDLLS